MIYYVCIAYALFCAVSAALNWWAGFYEIAALVAVFGVVCPVMWFTMWLTRNSDE